MVPSNNKHIAHVKRGGSLAVHAVSLILYVSHKHTNDT